MLGHQHGLNARLGTSLLGLPQGKLTPFPETALSLVRNVGIFKATAKRRVPIKGSPRLAGGIPLGQPRNFVFSQGQFGFRSLLTTPLVLISCPPLPWTLDCIA